MLSCSKCRKAFTFAEVRETDLSLRELAEIDLREYHGDTEFSDQGVDEWIEEMEYHLERLEIGDQVIYLDGHYIPVETENVEIEGIFANHAIEKLPHQCAESADELRSILGNSSYWLERAVEGYEWLDDNNPYELYQEAISEIADVINKAKEIPFDDQFFYRMLFTQIYSITEAFLSDRLKQLILLNDHALSFFCKNDNKVKGFRYDADTVFKGKAALRKSVIGSIQGRIFHNFNNVVRDFQSACNTTIEIERELIEIAKSNQKRHNCVHRNGRDEEGILLPISRKELQGLLDISQVFCLKIETCVSTYISLYPNSDV